MREPRQLALHDALKELAKGPVAKLAGGTDFYPSLGDQAPPEQVLDITRIEGLRGIEESESGWRIGAATTWTDIVNTPLAPVFDGLKSAAREVGSVQIQNAGTVGGNLCNASPAADGVPPLMALDASLELASIRGHRRLPLANFIHGSRQTALAPDELLIAVHVPSLPENARSVFQKLGARRFLVISIAMVSVTLAADTHERLTDVRVVVGACSAVAQRLPELEHALLGQSIHSDILSFITPAMFSPLRPIDDVRGSGVYRLSAAQQLVYRLLSECIRLLRPGLRSEMSRLVQSGESS